MQKQEPFEYLNTILTVVPKQGVTANITDFVSMVIAGNKDEALKSFDVVTKKTVDLRPDEEKEKELFKANLRQKRTRKQAEAEAVVAAETVDAVVAAESVEVDTSVDAVVTKESTEDK